MGQAARRYMEDRSFDAAFMRSWQMYDECVSEAENAMKEAV